VKKSRQPGKKKNLLQMAELNKCCHLFIRTNDETPSIAAMKVSNPERRTSESIAETQREHPTLNVQSSIFTVKQDWRIEPA
jgi:hypothetical protein